MSPSSGASPRGVVVAFVPRGRTVSRPAASASPVLAVGRRVFVNCAGDRQGSGTLMDENDHVPQGRLADGIEVVVMAWRPRGSAGTRYRVQGADGADGWLHAVNLRTTLAAPPAELSAGAPVEPVL